MYCSNCGELLYGYRNDEGKIKYECKRCGTVTVRIQKGRRHNKIDLYAPEGLSRGWTILHKKRAATHICECSSSAGSPRAFFKWAAFRCLYFFTLFSKYKPKMSGTSASVSFRALHGAKMFSKFIMCLSCSCALEAFQETALRVHRPSEYGGIGATASASSWKAPYDICPRW